MTPAEKERAAIVRWMRENAAALYRHAADKRLPIRDRLEAEIIARRDEKVAGAISRSEHLKEGR